MSWACLSEPLLCCLDTAKAETKLFYDEYHQSILFLVSKEEQQIFQVRLPTSETMVEKLVMTRLLSVKENALSIHFMGAAVEYAQLSRDSKYLALQKSDIEVVVVHLQSQVTKWILCCPRPGNQLLCNGLRWIGSSEHMGEMLLLTKHGVEHYVFKMAGAENKHLLGSLHRIVRLERASCFWFSSMHDTLLVSFGHEGNALVCFVIHSHANRPSSLTKLPRLRFTYGINPSDIYLASMYGELHAIYSDSKRNSTKLLVYSISACKMTCIRALTLLFPPEANLRFSVVDNILICHSLAFHVSLFFDIKCEGVQGGQEPFCPPLPVSFENLKTQTKDGIGYLVMLSVHGRCESSDTRSGYCSRLCSDEVHFSSIEEDVAAKEKTQVLSVDWDLFQPQHFYRLSQTHLSGKSCVSYIEIRCLRMDLTEITKSSGRNPELVAFLLRREGVETQLHLVFDFVQSKLCSKVDLEEASILLSALRSCSTRYIQRHLHEMQDKKQNLHKVTRNGPNSSYTDCGRQTQNLTNPCLDGQDVRNRLLTESEFELSTKSKTAMLPIRRRDGTIVIAQEQVAQSIWYPLSDHSIATSGLLSMYLCEYLKVLHYAMTPVDSLINVLYARSFIKAKHENQLLLLLQSSALADSAELAQFLVGSPHFSISGKEGTKHFPAFVQAGLDMYQRLGEYALMVKMLLKLERIEEAMKIALKHKNLHDPNAQQIPVYCFYDALCTSVSKAESKLSIFQITMKFTNMLHFVRRWDKELLERSVDPPHISLFAKNITQPFPEKLLPDECEHKAPYLFMAVRRYFSCKTLPNCPTAVTIFGCQLQLTHDDQIGSLYIDVRSRYGHFGMSDKEVSDGDEYDEDWDEGSQTQINDDVEIAHSIELRFVDLNLKKDESELLASQIAHSTLELYQQGSCAQESPYKCSVQNDGVGHNNGKYYPESVVLIHGKRYDVRHSIFDGPNTASRRVTLYHEKCRVQEANLQRERDQARKKLHEVRHSIHGCYEDIGVAGIPAKQRLWMYHLRKRKSEQGKQEQIIRERRNRWYHQRTRPSQYNAKKEAAKYVRHQKYETQERMHKEQAVVSRIECNQRKLSLKSKRLLEYSTTGYAKGCHILETLASQQEHAA